MASATDLRYKGRILDEIQTKVNSTLLQLCLDIFIKLLALMDLYRYLDRFTIQLIFSFNVVQYISMHIVRKCGTSVGAPIVSG